MFRLSRLSIGVKLFVVIGGLLFAALAVMSAGLLQATRRMAIDAAHGRLTGVTRDLAGMLSANTPQRLDTTARLGRQGAVIRAFRQPGAAVPDTLRTLLANTRQMAGIELLGTRLERRATLGRVLPPLVPGQARGLVALTGTRGAGIGELRLVGDSIYYPTVVAVGAAAAPQGYVILWRRVAAAPQASRQLTQLVGSGSTLLIGNARGDVWTNLVGVAAGPPAPLTIEHLMDYERPGTGAVLARARPIPGTPWVVMVEFPKSLVLAPVRSFLMAELGIMALLVVVGGLLAWLLGRRISGPLAEVTRAAETIAAGDLSTRLRSTRQDEIGRLASAFNVMADHVQRSRDELEERVAARTQELQAANSELEAFSYSVSHDLRSPLRAIDGFSRMLTEDYAQGVGPEGRRLLDVIRLNTKRMGHLIDDLLAFSKMGRQLLSKGRVDLAALARDVLAEAQAAHPDRKVTVDVGPLGSNWGDRAMLRHVFANLVENAFKFTRNEAATRITVGVERRQGEAVYFVRDNGVGFDQRYAAKLFGVFQRLHRAEDFEGTGVGLAIVQRIVYRHGGRVWAEGTVGGGATFYFTLPHEEAAA
jgi:signal transduction histidine kinase